MTGAGTAPLGSRLTRPSVISSRSCCVRTFCEIPLRALFKAAKCFGDSAKLYTIIIFHLPPIAASAAVNGHPPTGFSRLNGELPEGAFLIAFIGLLIFHREVNHDRRSKSLQNQTRSA